MMSNNTMETEKIIPEGYKNTEIGVIPEDWEVKPLGDFVKKFINGGTPSTSIAENWEGEIPWITGADILNQKVAVIRRYITPKALKNSSTNVIRKGNILFVSRTGVGKLAIAPFDVAISQDFTGIYLNESEMDTHYLFWYFNYINNQLKSNNQGTSIQGITRETLAGILIPSLKITEQTAIATALSDMDALIEGLEKLIEKKRKIKQGAMQELLKPKEGWEDKKLGEMLTYEQPTKYIVNSTEYNPNTGVPVLTAGKSFILGFTDEITGIYKDIPVIIFDDFTTSIQFVDFKFKVKSSAMKILKIRTNEYIISFLFPLMKLIAFDATDHKRYWISEYQEIEVSVPHKEEQIRIAQYLSDLGDEIEQLEIKHSKYKNMKVGMMQELLTGKRRLIDDGKI